MNELALFAGAGGGILGGHLLGWKTVAACEIEDYPRETLLRRQLDGLLPRFPIWDDICTFDGKPFRGKVDIITGGFPCQDISAAGKGAGITGERSGLWSEMARVIGEVRPRFAFMENSPMLTSRGLGTVLGDLAKMGFDARWCVLGADDAGAPHRRKRIWILAYSVPTWKRRIEREGKIKRNVMADADESRLQRPDVRKAEHGTESGLSTERSKITWWDSDPADVPNTMHSGLQTERPKQQTTGITGTDPQFPRTNKRKPKGQNSPTQPQLGRVAHGVANRVDRLKAIGNGQVSGVAAIAFIILSEGLI